MLADLESLEKRVANLEKKAKARRQGERQTTLRLINLALTQLQRRPPGPRGRGVARRTRRPGTCCSC